MSTTATTPRENSIDFLRLAFAMAVIVAHCYGLGGFKPGPLERFARTPSIGDMAVAGFFLLSGFLITGSYTSVASLPRFLWHRALRILPGFWCCLLVTVTVFAPIVYWKERGTLNGYLDPSVAHSVVGYLQANFWLRMRQYAIHDLLRHVPNPYTFDGSLWTLFNEFLCYLAIGVLGVTGLLRRAKAVPVLLAAALLVLYQYHETLPHLAPVHWIYAHIFFWDSRRVGQAVYFFLGASAYLYRDRLALNRYAFLAALLIFGLDFTRRTSSAALPVAFSYCVLWLAFRLPFTNIAKRGDLSYGLYIYASPIQQLLALYGLNRWGYGAYLAATLAMTLPLAALSWYFVERPCLRLKGVCRGRGEGRGRRINDHAVASIAGR